MSSDGNRPEIGDVVEYPRLVGKTDESGADSTLSWIVLYPDDLSNLMIDEPGNLALLVDSEQAREVKRLAERAIEDAEDGDGT